MPPRRRGGFGGFGLIVLAALSVTPAAPPPPPGGPKDAYVPGEVLIGLKASPAQGFTSKVDSGALRPVFDSPRWGKARGLGFESVYRLVLDDGESVDAAVAGLSREAEVDWVEPNFYFWATGFPSDADFSLQWGLDNTGQTGGTFDADIDAPEAWDIETGSPEIVLAVIDTGVDWDHPDLASKIWTNPGEVAGNGIDDEGNGFVDDVRGWDFVTSGSVGIGEDGGPRDNDPADTHGHGTHVAGIAAADSDNVQGVVGVCWGCTIMPVRAGYRSPDGLGTFRTSDVAAAVVYAVDNGATVLNMSLAGPNYSKAIEMAIDYARAAGTIVVAAAGNENDQAEVYPAAFEGVIAVAASDPDDARSIWSGAGPGPGHASNYGSRIDVAAPGSGVRSTFFDDGYETLNGTSTAAPHVTGLAGLILSARPWLRAEEVSMIIRSTTDPVDSQEPIGTGRINALRALQVSSVPVATLETPSPDAFVVSSVEVFGSAWSRGLTPRPRRASRGHEFVEYTLEYGAGFYPPEWTVLTHSFTPVPRGLLGTWPVDGDADGEYTLRLSVSDAAGNTATAQRPVFVQKTLHTGWPRPVQSGVSPLLVDLDGDGALELVLAQEDGTVGAYRDDGTPVPGWPKELGVPLRAAPAGADLDGDGRSEVVVATHDEQGSNRVHVWDGAGRALPGWPRDLGGQEINTPAIADVDDDGQLEIVGTTLSDYDGLNEGTIFVWETDGSDMAPFPMVIPIAGTFLDYGSSPVVGDLDGDRDLEILVGFKDGSLHALHHDGSEVEGWPKQVHDGFTVFGVALGDVDADGRTEVVATSRNSGAGFAWEADGSPLPGWPIVDNATFSADEPTLADLDGDGTLEVLFHSSSDVVYACHADGSFVDGWPVQVDANTRYNSWAPPAVGDVDGDGSPDIVQATDERRLLVWRADGTHATGWPKSIAGRSLFASPALGDVDGDGLLELLAVDDGLAYLWDLPTPATPGPRWSTYRGNARRTGVFPNPQPSLTALQPQALGATGSPATLVLEGRGFVAGSRVVWNGVERETRFLSPTRLEMTVSAMDTLSPHAVEIAVRSPEPGGGRTTALTLDVTPALRRPRRARSSPR